MTSTPDRPDRTDDPSEAVAAQRRKWPEVSRLAAALRAIIEENHLSPRIEALYRGQS